MKRYHNPFVTAPILHTEGRWKLKSTKQNNTKRAKEHVWMSVIEHDCPEIEGEPYWMLIHDAAANEYCMSCKDRIPDSIVCLFKLMNWENIQ